MLLIANGLSTIGAVILLFAYYQMTVKHDETSGMIFSGIGSLIMCVAFYLFESNAFIFLNIAWMCISAYGLVTRRQNKGSIKRETGPLAKGVAHTTLLIITTACLWFYVVDNMAAISWLSIILFLMVFFFFSSKSIDRKCYVLYSLAASLLALPYVLHIMNYGSAMQLSIDIMISLWSLLKMRGALRSGTPQIIQ